MPDLSTELNLALAVGTDDTRDYLRGASPSLRTSLLILDGLFSSVTGHTHNGAHQGGQLTFQNLSVGATLDVTGASNLHGTVHAYSGLQVDGAATVAGMFTASGNGAVGGNLQVSGTTTLSGNTNVGQALTVGTNITATGNVNAGAEMNTGGWIRINAASVGVYNSVHNAGISFDAGGPTVYGVYGGGHLITETATQTLSNKTINSSTLNGATFNGGGLYSTSLTNPTLAGTVSGQPAWASSQSFPGGSRTGGLLTVAAKAGDWVIDGGQSTITGIGSGGTTTAAINFNAAYNSPPKVVCTVGAWSGGIGSIGQMNWEVQGITTNGFTVAIYNVSGATQQCVINWLSFGS